MCEKGEKTIVAPGLLKGIKYASSVKEISLDSCISDLVLFLSDRGLLTYGSCCGHGKGEGWIQFRHDVELARHLMMMTYVEDWYIKIIPNGTKTIRIVELGGTL